MDVSHLITFKDNNPYKYFEVKTTLSYFDDELAERVINNDESIIYDVKCKHITKCDLKEFLKKIFIERVAKIRMCAGFKFSVLPFYINAVTEYKFSDDAKESIANPLLNCYGDLGMSSNFIRSAIQCGDAERVFNICVATCGSIDFADSVVLYRFIEELDHAYDYNIPCVELDHGARICIKEFIQQFINNKGES